MLEENQYFAVMTTVVMVLLVFQAYTFVFIHFKDDCASGD